MIEDENGVAQHIKGVIAVVDDGTIVYKRTSANQDIVAVVL